MFRESDYSICLSQKVFGNEKFESLIESSKFLDFDCLITFQEFSKIFLRRLFNFQKPLLLLGAKLDRFLLKRKKTYGHWPKSKKVPSSNHGQVVFLSYAKKPFDDIWNEFPLKFSSIL